MTSGSTEVRCKACAADIPADAAVCPRCGTSQHMEVCPLCGATAGVSRDEELRYRCDVCGGPRVPLDKKGVRRSGKEVALLKRADAARKARARSRAGAVLAGIATAGAFGVVALVGLLGAIGVLDLGLGFVLGSLFVTAPLIAAVAWLVSKARASGKEIAPALDAAWIAAATDVAEQSSEPVTARSLAEALRIEAAQAEEHIALLEAHDVVRDNGRFLQPSRLRIDAPAGASATEAAELEAQAEAEADHEERADVRRDKPS